MTDSDSDSGRRPDRPKFEGQVVFKGDFRTDDDPDRLVDALSAWYSRGADVVQHATERVRSRR